MLVAIQRAFETAFHCFCFMPPHSFQPSSAFSLLTISISIYLCLVLCIRQILQIDHWQNMLVPSCYIYWKRTKTELAIVSDLSFYSHLIASLSPSFTKRKKNHFVHSQETSNQYWLYPSHESLFSWLCNCFRHLEYFFAGFSFWTQLNTHEHPIKTVLFL